jgi:hypothetical protein
VPPMVAEESDDFRLLDTSITRDADTAAVSDAVSDDDVGVTRPQGAGRDIGACEWNEGGDTTAPASPTGLTVQ